MQWKARERNGGFSSAPPDKLYAPVINDETYGYNVVNVDYDYEVALRSYHIYLGVPC